MDFQTIVGAITIIAFLFTAFIEWPRFKERLAGSGMFWRSIDKGVLMLVLVSMVLLTFTSVLQILDMLGIHAFWGIELNKVRQFVFPLSGGSFLLGIGLLSLIGYVELYVLPSRFRYKTELRRDDLLLLYAIAFVVAGGLILRTLVVS